MRTERSQIEIDLSYMAVPEIEGKKVIITDPMLVTSKSLVKTVDALLARRTSFFLDITTVISVSEGLELLNKKIIKPFKIWTGTIDDHLNDKSCKIPRLGDASDLSSGSKV